MNWRKKNPSCISSILRNWGKRFLLWASPILLAGLLILLVDPLIESDFMKENLNEKYYFPIEKANADGKYFLLTVRIIVALPNIAETLLENRKKPKNH